MSHAIRSNIKIYEHAAEIFIHNLTHTMCVRITKIVTAFGECYFTRSEGSSHIRYYVDPITGRAIPV
ncbi:MAG: hypothetical protein V4496_00610 [Pseudomonadota bacterium]